jgi:excinuclease ABC subunit C
MVKDDRHRTRAMTSEGGEIAISPTRGAYTLVSSIQEETHRFAVQYARGAHGKTAFSLALTTVPGIGPARARALFHYFRTKAAILAAGEEELCQVKRMSRAAAQALRSAVKEGEIS